MVVEAAAAPGAAGAAMERVRARDLASTACPCFVLGRQHGPRGGAGGGEGGGTALPLGAFPF